MQGAEPTLVLAALAGLVSFLSPCMLRFWPAWYLIDADGFVRYRHFGEGAYDETEQRIRELLAEKNRIYG